MHFICWVATVCIAVFSQPILVKIQAWKFFFHLQQLALSLQLAKSSPPAMAHWRMVLHREDPSQWAMIVGLQNLLQLIDSRRTKVWKLLNYFCLCAKFAFKLSLKTVCVMFSTIDPKACHSQSFCIFTILSNTHCTLVCCQVKTKSLVGVPSWIVQIW